MNVALGIIKEEVAKILIPLWVTNFGLVVLGFPVLDKVFKKNKKLGLSISSFLSLSVLSYVNFLLATAVKNKNLLSTKNLLLPVILGIFSSGIVLYKRKEKLSSSPVKNLAEVQAMFMVVTFVLYILKSFDPQIIYVERTMDFSILKALFKVQTLPLKDMWFSGQPLNYYYFGHFMAFTFLRLSGIDVLPGFFATTIWMYGNLFVISFYLGKALFEHTFGEKSRIAGIISAFLITFGGTLNIVVPIGEYFAGLIKRIPVAHFPYTSLVRFIPYVVTNVPFYGFVAEELHANTWGILIGITTLALLFSFWTSSSDVSILKSPQLFLSVFLLGIVYMSHSWDALSLGILTEAVLAAKLIKIGKNSNIRKHLLLIPLIATGSYAIATPWQIYYSSPVKEIGLVESGSPLWRLLVYWGIPIIIGVLYARKKVKIDLPLKTLRVSLKDSEVFMTTITLTGLLLIIFVELFYFKDPMSGSEHYRFNSFWKVSVQVFIWVTLTTGVIMCNFLQKGTWREKIVVVTLLAFSAYYSVFMAKEGLIVHRKFTGISNGLSWWEGINKDEYEIYKILESQKIGGRPVLLEAPGDSYTHQSLLTAYLGWQTPLGWQGHEYTWRDNPMELQQRYNDINKIYTVTDEKKLKNLLKRYSIEYILVGKNEHERYEETLNAELIKEEGIVTQVSGGTFIVRVF